MSDVTHIVILLGKNKLNVQQESPIALIREDGALVFTKQQAIDLAQVLGSCDTRTANESTH